jgi:hypothetical protein
VTPIKPNRAFSKHFTKIARCGKDQVRGRKDSRGNQEHTAALEAALFRSCSFLRDDDFLPPDVSLTAFEANAFFNPF